MSRSFTLEATCAFGLESVVGNELRSLGYHKIKKDNGRVTFEGDWEAICKANLWLRCADRVRIILSSFYADDFEALFQGAGKIDWVQLLPVDACFPVNAKSIRSKLHSSPHIQSVVKKSVVERLKKHYHVDWFGEKGATYAIEAEIRNDQVKIALDTSGPGLNKRCYRKAAGEAPIKETLAAALVYLSGWKYGNPLADPMCGSGTILIEAAMIGLNMAPGLMREFACEDWKCMEPGLWNRIRRQARAARKDNQTLCLLGYDHDPSAIASAHLNAQNAGVSEYIRFQTAQLKDFSSAEQFGCMISNPPYGKRLEDEKTVYAIKKTLAKIMDAHPTWSFHFLTGQKGFENYPGRKADKNRKLYNGRIQCYYYQYFQGGRS